MGEDTVIGWIREIMLDCPDPWVLARFWSGLLGGTPGGVVSGLGHAGTAAAYR